MRTNHLVLFFLIVSLMVTACSLPDPTAARRELESRLAAELPNDCSGIPVSQEAVLSFLTKVLTAGQTAPETKTVRLTITQEEITSFIAIGAQLAEQYQELQNLQNLENPELGQIAELEGMESPEAIALLRQLEQLQRGDGPAGLPIPDLSLRLALQEPQVCFKGSGRMILQGYVAVRGRRQPIRLVTAPRAAQGELVLDFVEGDLGPVSLPETLFDQIGTGLARTILAGQKYAEVMEIQVAEGSLTLAGRWNT